MTPTSASCFARLSLRGEARCVRPEQNARDEVADDRREPDAVGDEPEHECRTETPGEREDEIDRMHRSKRRRLLPLFDALASRSPSSRRKLR